MRLVACLGWGGELSRDAAVRDWKWAGWRAASVVFLLEPSVNVAVEQQALARVHRFGQTRPVRIVRFICDATVEARLAASWPPFWLDAQPYCPAAPESASSGLACHGLHIVQVRRGTASLASRLLVAVVAREGVAGARFFHWGASVAKEG